MSTTPNGMDAIMRAVTMLQAADRAAARCELLRLWSDLGEYGSPAQRCTLAHFLADTEERGKEELAWDLIALEAATGSSDHEDRDAVEPSLASFLPSLHLNVGDAYRRRGDSERAVRHAILGLSRADHLEDGGYVETIRKGLIRLRQRSEVTD